nr:hypothetical protein [Bradyrhizobium sp. SZCCHNR1045]
MSHIGIGFGEPDDDLEKIADRAAGAARGDRQSQCTEPRLLDQGDLPVRQDAFAFALGLAFGDLGQQGVKSARRERNGRPGGKRVGGERLVH